MEPEPARTEIVPPDVTTPEAGLYCPGCGYSLQGLPSHGGDLGFVGAWKFVIPSAERRSA
jgi:hypothetical protein